MSIQHNTKCFDVVDHQMLLTKLQQYNIDLTWFRSYLHTRSHAAGPNQANQWKGDYVTQSPQPSGSFPRHVSRTSDVLNLFERSGLILGSSVDHTIRG